MARLRLAGDVMSLTVPAPFSWFMRKRTWTRDQLTSMRIAPKGVAILMDAAEVRVLDVKGKASTLLFPCPDPYELVRALEGWKLGDAE